MLEKPKRVSIMAFGRIPKVLENGELDKPKGYTVEFDPISWGKVDGAFQYDIAVSDSETFDSKYTTEFSRFYVGTSTRWFQQFYPYHAFGNTFYVKVRAVDEEGNKSEWSDTGSWTVPELGHYLNYK